jgi:hypothetical protein
MNCNVHVFYKIIFSNKFGFIMETSLFLYLIKKFSCNNLPSCPTLFYFLPRLSYVCFSIHISICPSISLSVVCLSICSLIYLPVRLSVCPSVVCPCVFLSVYLSVALIICTFSCLSNSLSVYIFYFTF